MKKTYVLIIIVCTLIILSVLLILVLTNINSEEKAEVLTIEIVERLVKEKNDQLNWSDFDKYHHDDIGSGMYIHEYVINQKYKLQIGGRDLNNSPDYIYLIKNSGEKIDIRYDNVNDFIEK